MAKTKACGFCGKEITTGLFKGTEKLLNIGNYNCISCCEDCYNKHEEDANRVKERLGVKLDKAKSSIMFGNKTTLLLIKESMSMVSSEILGDGFSYNPDPTVQTTNDKIYELFEDIENELDTIAVLNQSKQDSNFWQHEMESYLALKNIAENSGSISSTDDILPYGEDLDTAYSCYTIPKQSLNRVISFTVKQLKTNETNGIEGKINELIDDIAANIEAETLEEACMVHGIDVEELLAKLNA